MNQNIKFVPKKIAQIVYLTLIGIGILLTIARWYSVINPNFVLFNEAIHYRISNLSLSMMLYLGIGYMWILCDVKFRFIILLGVFIIASNIICETLIGFLNTPDIYDAISGCIGSLIAFTYLFLTKKYGLVLIEHKAD